MLVRGVVIDDEMKDFISRRLLVEEFEKPQPFLMPMLRHAGAKYGAIQGVHGSEQRGRSKSGVVMRHGVAATSLNGQAGLSAVQRLNL